MNAPATMPPLAVSSLKYRALADGLAALALVPDLDRALGRVLQALADSTSLRRAAVSLADSAGGRQTLRAWVGLRSPDRARALGQPSLAPLLPQMHYAIPIVLHGERVGVLAADRPFLYPPLPSEDLDLLTQAAGLMAHLAALCARPALPETRAAAPGASPGLSLRDMERAEVVAALQRNAWVQHRAAQDLGLTARQMGYRVRKFGLHTLALQERAKARFAAPAARP